MKSKYTILVLALLILGLVYYLISYQTKENYSDNRQPNQSLQELVNKIVTLEGITANAKSGAVLLVDDSTVYVEGLNYWPKDFIDKQITLSGKLVFKSYIPQAQIDENGLVSQGGSGQNNYVLENVDVGKYK